MNNNHNNNKASFVLILMMIMNCITISMATLRVGFYKESCPSAESIIQQIVHQTFLTKKSVTPALLRMHYHDCFVRGCDASILLDSTRRNQAEKAAAANSGIQEYQLIDIIKARLEQICPKTVSCADIIALATRDAVALASGPNYDVPTGRRDGLISRSNEVNLPGPTSTVSDARKAFEAHGLTLNDMVVLLGAHTVGTTHCSFIKDRLSNFNKSGAPDPTMERGLVKKLKKTCGSKNNVDRTVFLDQNTSFVVDNMYYKEIVKRQGVLKIDQIIAQDKQTSKLVAILAKDNSLFGEQFAKTLVKLGTLQVMEGNNGEIRRNCRMVNN